MSSVKNMTNSVEPHGSAVALIGRPFTFAEYQLTRDIVVPAMDEAEAAAWIAARAPRMRGNPREALLYFLTNRWELREGWRIGARYVSYYHVVVAWGGVDALGRFMRKLHTTGVFAYSSAPRVLELIVERINQASTNA